MNQIRFGGIPYLHLDVYQGHDHVFNIQVEDDSTKEIIRYQEGVLTCKVRRNNPQGGVVLTLTPKFNNDTNCVDLYLTVNAHRLSFSLTTTLKKKHFTTIFV